MCALNEIEKLACSSKRKKKRKEKRSWVASESKPVLYIYM